MDAPPANLGGSGDPSALVDPHHARRDLALIRRAVRERWVSDARAERILAEMEAICCDQENADPRNKIAAARVVMAGAAIDARREATDQQAETAGDELEFKRQLVGAALADIQRRRREMLAHNPAPVSDAAPTRADVTTIPHEPGPG
jgi:hypothetical protein